MAALATARQSAMSQSVQRRTRVPFINGRINQTGGCEETNLAGTTPAAGNHFFSDPGFALKWLYLDAYGCSAPEEHHVYRSRITIIPRSSGARCALPSSFTCRSSGAERLELTLGYKHIAPTEQGSPHNKRDFLVQSLRSSDPQILRSSEPQSLRA